MSETWLIPVAILLASAVVLLVPIVEARSVTIRQARFPCTFVGRDATVAYGERAILGIVAATEVRSCSALADPEAPACERRCLGAVPSAVAWSARTQWHGQNVPPAGHSVPAAP